MSQEQLSSHQILGNRGRSESRNLFLGRLRHRLGAVEQEDSDLLVGLLAVIHRPMNAGSALPTRLDRGVISNR